MSTEFSSSTQTYVTQYTLQDIEREEQILKDTKIIYLHVKQRSNGENKSEAIGKVSVGLLKEEHDITEFNDTNECCDYISENLDTKIHLILSDALDEDTVTTLNGHSHVAFIYQINTSFPWIKYDGVPSNSKVLTSLLSPLNIFNQLSDPASALEDFEPCLSQNRTVDARLFIIYQLLMEIIFRILVAEADKIDFIKLSLETYPACQKKIDEFNENFTPDQAIQWFTKQSSVYRILSRVFGTNDLRQIYRARYYIHYLYEELKNLHKITFDIWPNHIQVYRGKIMYINEFEKLKASIGQLVFNKCFMSTSVNKKVAMIYAGDKTQLAPGKIGVIFHMKIDKVANKSKPFAYLGEKSRMPDEEEFLLPPGVVFRIKDINDREVCQVYT